MSDLKIALIEAQRAAFDLESKLLTLEVEVIEAAIEALFVEYERDMAECNAWRQFSFTWDAELFIEWLRASLDPLEA